MSALTAFIKVAASFASIETSIPAPMYVQVKERCGEAAIHYNLSLAQLQQLKETTVFNALQVRTLPSDLQAALDECINSAIAQVIFCDQATVNRLPDDVTSTKKDLLSRTFSPLCDRQWDGWSCGYRAFLHAFSLNWLTARGKRISPDTLREGIKSCLKGDSSDAEEQNSSALFRSKIKGCIEHMLAKQDFVGDLIDSPEDPKYGRQAEDCHLKNLAESLGVRNVHFLRRGEDIVKNEGQPASLQLGPNIPCYRELLACANNGEAIEEWIEHYNNQFGELLEQIQHLCDNNETYRDRYIRSYADRELKTLNAIFEYERNKKIVALNELRECVIEEDLKAWIIENRDIQVLSPVLLLQEERIREVIRSAREQGRADNIHFLCQIPGHWILISVMIQENGAPVMVILDSLNRVESTPGIGDFISYIDNVFINPVVQP